MSKKLFFINFPRIPYIPEKTRKWIYRPWVILCCFAPAIIIVLVNTVENGSFLNSFWHIVLVFSIFASLTILSDRPLLNPIQVFVFLAYGWFSLGPCVEVLWNMWWQGGADVEYLIERGVKTLWVFCLGLPLYAATSRSVLNLMERKKLWLKFLQPFGNYFRPKTLFIFLSVGLITTALLNLFHISGVNPLGLGVIEQPSWTIYLINALTGVSSMGAVGIFWYIAARKGEVPPLWRTLGWIMLIFSVVMAIPSSSKGAIVYPFAIIIIILTTKKQHPPFKLLFIFILVFYFIVLPFVTDLRYLAQSETLTSKSDAKELLLEYVKTFKFKDVRERADFDPAVFFRSIYYYAGIVADRSNIFSGPWGGYTYKTGFLALIPRVIWPEKPDLNIGNYVASDIGAFPESDHLTNIGVSLPIEAWGNFGAFAAVLSFGFIGIMWSLVCGLALSPQRLHDHPIAPIFVLQTMGFEGVLGHFLSGTLKMYPFMLFGAWIIKKCFLKKF